MGRKIPSRKHRGVVDPEKQRAIREAKLKDKINAPPSKEHNDQPVPKRLQELIRAQSIAKKREKRKQKLKRDGKAKRPQPQKKLLSTAKFINEIEDKQPGMKRAEKMLPVLEQRPWEKEKAFLYRVHRMCDDVIKEVQFEKKFKVEVQRNQLTGSVEKIKKESKNEVDEILKLEVQKAKEAQNPKGRRKKKQDLAGSKSKDTKLKNVEDRRKLKREKLQQKALRKKEEEMDLPKRDFIKFGEVVDRPPDLKILPRKAVIDKTNTNLLLSRFLDKSLKDSSVQRENSTIGQNTKKSTLTGKRKDLPLGQRRMLEEQQKNVVAAYRLLKLKKKKE